MGSQYPPHCYDDATLLALEQVLEGIWVTLKAHDPLNDWKKATELKTLLAEKLMALADVGITNPDELRQKTLESLPLNFDAR
jgi:hypothetical protein